MKRESLIFFYCVILNVLWLMPCMSAPAQADDGCFGSSFGTFAGEPITCTDPADADADDDGIPDMDEDANQNGILDMDETDPCSPDTDGDGIQDGTELGLTLASIGPDTDTSLFIPDMDPDSTTNPLAIDTDYDGLTDGEEDTNFNGRLDGLDGEHDPEFYDSYLYDGFTSPFLDPDKWDRPDKIREIRAGRLFSSIGGRTDSGGLLLNQTSLQNVHTVNNIEADITYLGGEVANENTYMVGAQIEGDFYSDIDGNVWAGINIGDRGEGPEAWWAVMSGGEEYHSGNLPVEIQAGVQYKAGIAYDPDANRFTFSIDDVSVSFTGTDRTGPAWSTFKSLTTGVWGNGSLGMGRCAAYFDNVRINGESDVYEDFEDVLINPSRWRNLESVRSICNNRLRIEKRVTNRTRFHLMKFVDDDSLYLKARVTVNAETSAELAADLIGLGAFLYNDTYDDIHNGLEGDISASVYLIAGGDHTLRARAYLKRIADPQANNLAPFFQEDFHSTIDFDIPNTVSIERKGNTVLFRCNDEVIEYDITGTMYPASHGVKGINYGVSANAGQGFIKASVDDVSTVHEVSRPYDFDYTDDRDVDGLDLATAVQNGDILTENMVKYLARIYGTVLD